MHFPCALGRAACFGGSFINTGNHLEERGGKGRKGEGVSEEEERGMKGEGERKGRKGSIIKANELYGLIIRKTVSSLYDASVIPGPHLKGQISPPTHSIRRCARQGMGSMRNTSHMSALIKLTWHENCVHMDADWTKHRLLERWWNCSATFPFLQHQNKGMHSYKNANNDKATSPLTKAEEERNNDTTGLFEILPFSKRKRKDPEPEVSSAQTLSLNL